MFNTSIILILLGIAAVADAFTAVLRHPHHHRRHGHNFPERVSFLPEIATLPEDGAIRKDRSLIGPVKRTGDEPGQEVEEGGPQIVGMRVLNTSGAGGGISGYWTWMESESHSLYMFAFTYFGTITLLLLLCLILMSCCYMYDCMGCYDPEWTSKKKYYYGNDSNQGRTEYGSGSKVVPVTMPRSRSSPTMAVQV